MDEADIEDLEVWPLNEDIAAEDEVVEPPKRKKKIDWDPVFVSEGFFSS